MDIFECENYRDYLRHRIFPNGRVKSSLNYKDVAEKLGYRSASLVSMILTGTRKPSSNFIDRFSKTYQLSLTEKNTLQSLVKKELKCEQTLKRCDLSNYSEAKDLLYSLIVNTICLSESALSENKLFTLFQHYIDETSFKKILKSALFKRLILRNDCGDYYSEQGALDFSKNIYDYDVNQRYQNILFNLQKFLMIPSNKHLCCGLELKIKDEKIRSAHQEIDDFRRAFFLKYNDKQAKHLLRIDFCMVDCVHEV